MRSFGERAALRSSWFSTNAVALFSLAVAILIGLAPKENRQFFNGLAARFHLGGVFSGYLSGEASHISDERSATLTNEYVVEGKRSIARQSSPVNGGSSSALSTNVFNEKQSTNEGNIAAIRGGVTAGPDPLKPNFALQPDVPTKTVSNSVVSVEDAHSSAVKSMDINQVGIVSDPSNTIERVTNYLFVLRNPSTVFAIGYRLNGYNDYIENAVDCYCQPTVQYLSTTNAAPVIEFSKSTRRWNHSRSYSITNALKIIGRDISNDDWNSAPQYSFDYQNSGRLTLISCDCR